MTNPHTHCASKVLFASTYLKQTKLYATLINENIAKMFPNNFPRCFIYSFLLPFDITFSILRLINNDYYRKCMVVAKRRRENFCLRRNWWSARYRSVISARSRNARRKINFEVTTKQPRTDDYRDSSFLLLLRYARYNISREHASC